MKRFKRLFQKRNAAADLPVMPVEKAVCAYSQHSAAPERAPREMHFRVYLPEVPEDGAVYCCILHHPLRSAWITPTSYPVDRLHVVYNGLLTPDWCHETAMEKWHITLLQEQDEGVADEADCCVHARWGVKTAYNAPLCDAMESWDFVLSRAPIDPDKYLAGYVHQFENVYANKRDLLEQKKRYKGFEDMLRK